MLAVVGVLVLGLIPACAGKTPVKLATKRAAPAHPRVCGENLTPSAVESAIEGSSPRVRGKPAKERGLSLAARLIPACAGKTCCSTSCKQCCEAHPRVCGENNRM